MAVYSDFVELNEGFTPVFRLDTDTKNANVWKRYIFTKHSFGNILNDMAPIFRNDTGGKRAFILQGTYGVGKSHATSVLSHLLWDDPKDLEAQIEGLKKETGEIGLEIEIYRKQSNKRLFPVLLFQKDSQDAWNSSQSFDLVLERALERSLKEYGYSERISEKTDYIRYYDWLYQSKSKKRKILEDVQEFLKSKENSDYLKLDSLLLGLKNGEPEALRTIKLYIDSNLGLSSPASKDAKEYYTNVLGELKQIDPSIDGIVIYWDEFTTVFQQAGKYVDAPLINNIQTWAELCKESIFLFLITHRGPDELASSFKDMEKDFAKISDRFKTIRLHMDELTTYRLISSSIMVKKGRKEEYEKFKNSLIGFDQVRLKQTIRDIFKDDVGVEEIRDITESFPIHPYSILVSTKLAERMGSVERSIFEMLHNVDEKQIGSIRMIGFGRFLAESPKEDKVEWYSTDCVFDFFYEALNDPKRRTEMTDDLRQMMCFHNRNAEEIRTKLGDEALKILKATILLEAFSFTGESYFQPTKENILKCFSMVESSEKIEDTLSKMTEGGYLKSYGNDKYKDSITYKIPLQVGDNQSLGKRREELRKHKKFSDLLTEAETKLDRHIRNRISTIKREIKVILIKTKKIGPKEAAQTYCQKFPSALLIILCVPENKEELEEYVRLSKDASKKCSDAVFMVADGDFGRYFDNYIDNLAEEMTYEEQGNKAHTATLVNIAAQNVADFVGEITKVKTIFRGNIETKDMNDIEQPLVKFTKEIFPRGFDDKMYSYDQFWTGPRGNSDRILILYGKPNSREKLANDGQYYEKKMIDVFKDPTGYILVGDDLTFSAQDVVRASPLYEIVGEIRKYVRNKSGEKVSLKEMIDDLGLDRPPFGLCGWLESIIITFALAEFYYENKLEAFKGADSATKHPKEIVGAVNGSISTTKNGKKLYIRYGTQTEKDIVDAIMHQLGDKLAISDDTPTLDQVKFAIRDSINNIGLPISLIPYSGFHGVECQAFIDVIMELIAPDNRTEEEMDSIRQFLISKEGMKDLSYWTSLMDSAIYMQGLDQFVIKEFPLEYGEFFANDIERLFSALRQTIDLDKDVWLWDDDKLKGRLHSLFKNKKSESHSQPEAFGANTEQQHGNSEEIPQINQEERASRIRRDIEQIAVENSVQFIALFKQTFAYLAEKKELDSQQIDELIDHLRSLRYA